MKTLAALLRTRYSLAWLALVAATLVSWYFGADHGLGARAATTLVLVVAFVKVRVVGLYFIELRSAPAALRGAFEGYCLLACSLLLGFYYFA